MTRSIIELEADNEPARQISVDCFRRLNFDPDEYEFVLVLDLVDPLTCVELNPEQIKGGLPVCPIDVGDSNNAVFLGDGK
jgi:hypothetical protein